MSIRPHPSFARDFRRGFLRGWIASAGLFAASMVAFHLGHESIGGPLAIGFVAAAAGTLGWTWWRLHRVACPNCGSATRTVTERQRPNWIAHCGSCGSDWDLGVGHDSSS
ncbi:MAG: hypothetical protein KGN16_18935 [Burkholderiales bacterium]|nr:hypothetical protein [Burkholderiales bacterium]